jgi:putative transposase
LDKWCFDNGIKLVFSKPGIPTDNCHIASFNGTFRYECLNSLYFTTMKESWEIVEDGRQKYNEERP